MTFGFSDRWKRRKWAFWIAVGVVVVCLCVVGFEKWVDSKNIWVMAEEGELGQLKYLLSDTKVRSKNSTKQDSETDGMTVLLIACNSGHNHIVEWVLRSFPVTQVLRDASSHQWNCLHFAAKHNHVEIIHTVKKHIANQDACGLPDVTEFGLNAMPTDTCEEEPAKEVQIGFEELCAQETWGNFTPILIACQYGHLNLVKELWGVSSSRQFDPLHIAAGHGQLAVVQWLVKDKNVKVDVCTKNWAYTPLLFAVQAGHFEVVKWLVEEGKANLEVQSSHGVTPVMMAITQGGEEMAHYLYLKGVETGVSMTSKEGITPFMAAVVKGELALAKWIYSQEGSPALEQKVESGDDPMALASKAKQHEMVAWLKTVS